MVFSRPQKLKKLTLNELKVRGAQQFAILKERTGWSKLTRLPEDREFLTELFLTTTEHPESLSQLHEYFRRRTNVKFFPGVLDIQATASEFKRRWPEGVTRLVERADRIIEGKFDLLSFKGLDFGSPIDWHLEPTSGKKAPIKHWSQLEYLNPTQAGDKKVTWELNRHQHFVTLGQAYALTGDEKYARTFVRHVEAWMGQNPPKLGINWASSLEVAFRSISWLWGLQFFKHSNALTSEVFARVLKFLYLNGLHLETFLSTYFSPNTHLTGEALGLYYLGTSLPEFQRAERWRSLGSSILNDWLPVQIRSDGVYFEQSSYYHRYTCDFYIHYLLLARANSDDVSEVSRRLPDLLNHLMHITRPDGTSPFFGDDDGGRLVMLDHRRANDFRDTLAEGAIIFARPDYKFVAADSAEAALWLLGTEGQKTFDALPATEPADQSVAFSESGYYVMRDSWTSQANYLLFDSGLHGSLNCGHAHADALSFELAANGQTILIDPGTSTYTGSIETRDWFRGTSAHNTLTIDGQPSSEPLSAFSWRTQARCETVDWITHNRFDFVKGRHDGFLRLTDPATHTRSIFFLKKNYWIIRDEVEATEEHQLDLWFHFETEPNRSRPLLEVVDGGATAVSVDTGLGGLNIVTLGGNGSWKWEDSWISHCYGEKTPSRACAFSQQGKGTHDLFTFLLPSMSHKDAAVTVREIEAVGGKAFEIRGSNYLDMLMVNQSAKVETARFASDFDWTLARFTNPDDPRPIQLILLHGVGLEFEGQQILKLSKPARYLSAVRTGDQIVIEADNEQAGSVGDLQDAFSQII